MTCPTAAVPGQQRRAPGRSPSARPCSSSGIGITRPLAMSTMHQQLLGRGHGLAGGLVKHRVEQMEALRADIEQLQRDREPVAERRLAQMVQVRLGGVEERPAARYASSMPMYRKKASAALPTSSR